MDTKPLSQSEDVRSDASYIDLMRHSLVEHMYGSKPRSRSMSESKSKVFEVQTQMVIDGWVNVWTQEENDDEPHRMQFDTEEEAQAAIDEFLKDTATAGLDYRAEDYRVVSI